MTPRISQLTVFAKTTESDASQFALALTFLKPGDAIDNALAAHDIAAGTGTLFATLAATIA